MAFFLLRLWLAGSPRRGMAVAWLFAGGVVGALLASVMIFPFLDLLSRSAIVAERVNVGSSAIGLGELRLWLAPDAWGYVTFLNDANPAKPVFDTARLEMETQCAYVGLATLSLVPAAFVRAERRALAAPLVALIAIYVACAYAVPGLHYLFSLVPLLGKTFLERVLFIPALALACLAALGLDAALKDARARRVAVASAGIVAALSLVLVLVTPVPFGLLRPAALVPIVSAASVGVLLYTISEDPLHRWAIPAVIAAELLVILGGHNRWANRKDVYPNAPAAPFRDSETGNFFATRGGILPESVAAVYRLRDIRGYDPMGSLRWRKFFDRLDPSVLKEARLLFFMLSPKPEWARVAAIGRFATLAAPVESIGWVPGPATGNENGAATALAGTHFRQPLACEKGDVLQVMVMTGVRGGVPFAVLDSAGRAVPIAQTVSLSPGLEDAQLAVPVRCPARVTVAIDAPTQITIAGLPPSAGSHPAEVDGVVSDRVLDVKAWSAPYPADSATWTEALAILHDDHARPFVWLADRAIAAKDADDALDRVEHELAAKDRWVVVETPDVPADAPLAGARATATRPRPDEIHVHTSATQPRWLVVQESWDPGWQATLDGASAPIVPANSIVQAIRVPAGDHDVVLRYRPRALRVGLGASALGLLLSAGLVAAARRAKKP